MTEIRASTILPARREPVTLRTADGLALVGELALPLDRPPVATLICLHPLPTAGGMMDSHVLRKAAYRLPALAGLAVLRFNTRGTSSERGTSEGAFGDGVAERLDVAAAIAYATETTCPAGGWWAGRSARSWPCATATTRPSRARSCCRRRCAGPARPTWTAGRPPAAPARAGPGVRRLPAAR